MTDDKTSGELVARHAELIGRVTLMWSDVHAQVGQLFEDFCASADARKQYRKIQSDRVQRQMLLSAGSVALQEHPDLCDQLEKTLAAIERLAADRNAAVHTYWAIDLPSRQNFATSPLAFTQTTAPRFRGSIQRTFEKAFRSLDKSVRLADRLL
jgi:hypothetical protein